MDELKSEKTNKMTTPNTDIIEKVLKEADNFICSCPHQIHSRQSDREHKVSKFLLKIVCEKALTMKDEENKKSVLQSKEYKDLYEEWKKQFKLRENFASKLQEIKEKIISIQKEGCGMDFILEEQDVNCGEDFEDNDGNVKVILCENCIKKVQEISKIIDGRKE